jgi:hypothetical protein
MFLQLRCLIAEQLILVVNVILKFRSIVTN